MPTESDDVTNIVDEISNEKTGRCGGLCVRDKRFVLVAWASIGMMIVHAMRTNVGFTVITILDVWAHEKVGTDHARNRLPSVQWSARDVALLHSVFYMGMFVTQIPAGYLTTKLPCHRLYGCCILVSCILNLLLPIFVDELGYIPFCVVRVLQGCSEGLLYPSLYAILRNWSIPSERGRVGGSVLTSAYAGAIAGFIISGLMTHYAGWEYVYYLHGCVGIIWVVAWLFVSYEKPAHHPNISDKELAQFDEHNIEEYENLKVPWLSILSSLPVISLCMCHIARNWVFILMLTNEPFYLSLFDFNIAENGGLSAVPHIMKTIMALASGLLADLLLRSSHWNTTVVRKLLTGVGFGTASVFFLFLVWTSNGVAAVMFLSGALGFGGLATSGWQINHYDLSARYAGVLVAVTSTVGTMAAIAAPLVVGELVSNDADSRLDGWQMVFLVTACIVAFAAILFTIVGSGEEQPWSFPPKDITLVQKVDPLARKPYNTKQLQNTAAYSVKTDQIDLLNGTPSLTEYGSNATVPTLVQSKTDMEKGLM